MTKGRLLPNRSRWRWLFGDRNEPVGIIEQHPDQSWHAIVDGKDVGTFQSEAAAKQFVEKLRDRTDAEGGGQCP